MVGDDVFPPSPGKPIGLPHTFPSPAWWTWRTLSSVFDLGLMGNLWRQTYWFFGKWSAPIFSPHPPANQYVSPHPFSVALLVDLAYPVVRVRPGADGKSVAT